MISIPVTSDVLPDRLEKKMHALITKTLHNTQVSLVTLALAKWSQKDIYEAGSNNRRMAIDKEKLKKVMTSYHRIYNPHTKTTADVTFLSEAEGSYGVNVVAFLIQRYRAIANAVKTIDQINSKDKGNENDQKKKTRRLKNDKRGGGEVYDMFHPSSQCVLNEGLYQKIQVLANTESNTNYFDISRGGRLHRNEIVNDIQEHMDAYYNFRKCAFPKTLHAHAYEMMEVYIKTMYLVKRGILQSAKNHDDMDDENTAPQLNILWGGPIVGSFICM